MEREENVLNFEGLPSAGLRRSCAKTEGAQLVSRTGSGSGSASGGSHNASLSNLRPAASIHFILFPASRLQRFRCVCFAIKIEVHQPPARMHGTVRPRLAHTAICTSTPTPLPHPSSLCAPCHVLALSAVHVPWSSKRMPPILLSPDCWIAGSCIPTATFAPAFSRDTYSALRHHQVHLAR